jgi:hypothetical protein
MDRAEATGFGVAVAGHAALLAIFSLGFANAIQPPMMNPPIEVSFVDEIGLQSAVTEISTEPPAQSAAPELGAPEEAAPAPAEMRAPVPVPKQALSPEPSKSIPAKAQPERPKASQAGKAKETRGSSLGDILKGIGSDASPSRSRTPSGATMSAQAMSSIVASIKRQIQPCADRQVNPGPGANRIRVTLNLRLNRDGSLSSRPSFVRSTGLDDENGRYEKRVIDLAIAAYTGCSPLRDLPEDLYQTPKGGWSNLNINYNLP